MFERLATYTVRKHEGIRVGFGDPAEPHNVGHWHLDPAVPDDFKPDGNARVLITDPSGRRHIMIADYPLRHLQSPDYRMTPVLPVQGNCPMAGEDSIVAVEVSSTMPITAEGTRISLPVTQYEQPDKPGRFDYYRKLLTERDMVVHDTDGVPTPAEEYQEPVKDRIRCVRSRDMRDVFAHKFPDGFKPDDRDRAPHINVQMRIDAELGREHE